MARRTRRTRCWTRKNRAGERYVVCNRSRGQKNVYRKKRKTRSKKKSQSGGRRRRNRHRNRRRKHRRTRRRQRGGMMRLSPSAFPPGGPYVQGGSMNGLGKGYYYKTHNPYLPDPLNLNSGVKNKIIQRGGGSFALENIPGATDARQLVWELGTGAKNFYQTWIGGKPYPSPSPADQPIGKPAAGPSDSASDDNIPQTYLAAQDTAAAYTVQ